MRESIELALRKPGYQPAFHFRMNVIKEVTEGAEGKKYIGTVESRFGEHGTYFLKEAGGSSRNKPSLQLERSQFLRLRGVKVPYFFRHVITPEGVDYILMTDLSGGGKYPALSLNSHKLQGDESTETLGSIPRQTRERICMELVHTSMVSANARTLSFNRRGESKPRKPILSFLPTMFTLVFDKDIPSNSQVFASDVGLDAHFTRDIRNNILLGNLTSVAVFYNGILGEPMTFGKHTRYEYLNPHLRDLEDQYAKRHLYAMGILT